LNNLLNFVMMQASDRLRTPIRSRANGRSSLRRKERETVSNWNTIDAATLKVQMTDGKVAATQIIDVREPSEWDYYHIEGSTHIPMNTIPGRLDELSDEQPLYIVCAHGVRSEKVCRYLADQGYGNLTNVAGGMAAVSALEGFQYD